MKFNALSLFSSAGIAETYFEKHGVNVCVAAELLPERVKLYKHLYPSVNIFEGDLTDNNIFESVIDKAKEMECDFIIATPPCQGMSSAGLQKKDDPRNRLIILVVEAIKRLNPKFVIIENVPEILITSIKLEDQWIKINDYLEKELSSKYYFNERKRVNAMHYGVAQSRERCVYLLSRKDTKIEWEFPEPSVEVTTLRDAIGDLPSLDPDVTAIFTSLVMTVKPLLIVMQAGHM